MEQNNLKSKKIETYTDDMVRAIENDKTGLVKKLIQEDAQQQKEKKNRSPDSRKNRIFVFSGVLLIGLALTTLAIILLFNQNIGTVPVEEDVASFIFVDKKDQKAIDDLTKDKIAKTLYAESLNTVVKKGGIEAIYLTEGKKPVSLKRLVALLRSNVINENNTKSISNNFMAGIHNGSQANVFLLLRLSSFNDAYSLMRSWENKLFFDLHGIFGNELSAETNYLFTAPFEDGTVYNKNARILHGNDGEIVLMYVFVDSEFVIVTDSTAAAKEVILRLASSKIKK